MSERESGVSEHHGGRREFKRDTRRASWKRWENVHTVDGDKWRMTHDQKRMVGNGDVKGDGERGGVFTSRAAAGIAQRKRSAEKTRKNKILTWRKWPSNGGMGFA